MANEPGSDDAIQSHAAPSDDLALPRALMGNIDAPQSVDQVSVTPPVARRIAGANKRLPPFRLRGRSFLAFVLSPELPIADWLAGLDRYRQHSPGFLPGRPMVLDLSGVSLTKYDFAGLIAELESRGIRLMGVEGAHPSWTGSGLPPLLESTRFPTEAVDARKNNRGRKPPSPDQTSLTLETPVRSGQTIFFPDGDVTIVGSVASGAEIAAGGSIHIYGVLRGRAMAGIAGNTKARIFCTKIEAELLAINGLYKLADEIQPSLRGRPAQAWLDGNAIRVIALE